MVGRSDNGESISVDGIVIGIIRSRRRTLELQVRPEGIFMRVPLRCADSLIIDFAKRKSTWLQQRSQQMAEQLSEAQRSFESGETFDLLGHPLTLHTEPGARGDVYQQDDRLIATVPKRVSKPENYIRKQLVNWYKQQAFDYISQTTDLYSEKMGLEFNDIRVRDYKARWGSCSADGKLSFNWRIIMAPAAAVDYVIIHELAHLQHFNHSNRFWRLVASVMPEYQQHRLWFRQHGQQLRHLL